jgi:hypothetical protein
MASRGRPRLGHCAHSIRTSSLELSLDGSTLVVLAAVLVGPSSGAVAEADASTVALDAVVLVPLLLLLESLP